MFKEKIKKDNKGFTLIELLTVMAIIAILAAISIFALAGARGSARDARRKGDLESIASALELYKADCNYYPSTIPAAGSTFTGAACSLGSNVYMQAVPADPLSTQQYVYQGLNCGATGCTRFKVWANLEDNPASLPAGCAPAVGGCGGAGNCDFCVFNP